MTIPDAMNVNDLDLPMLARNKVELHKDAVCRMCGGRIFVENSDPPKFVKNILDAKDYGVVHDSCFLPYVPENELKILFRIPCYSIGDTIATTPVLREVRKMYPRAVITVYTFYTDLFKHSPHVNYLLDANYDVKEEIFKAQMLVINGFDQSRGHHFAMHSVAFSSMSCLMKELLPTEWEYEVNYAKADYDRMRKVLKESGLDFDRDQAIVVHPHKTEWPTRDWGPDRMPELVKRLKEKYPGHKIITVGGKRTEVKEKEMKNYVAVDHDIDLYGRLTLLETMAFLDWKGIDLFVTPDTGALHVAATRKELPIVSIFTLIKAHFRTPVRQGRYGYKFIGVEADNLCNCTYTNRQLTNEMNFMECPKRAFLEQTLKSDIPIRAKLNGMQNIRPDFKWRESNFVEKMEEGIAHFDPKNLPCFPSVDKVFNACVAAMDQWGGK